MKVTTLCSRDFARNIGRARRAADDGPVIITNRGEPAYVLLSHAEYRRLAGGVGKQAVHSLVERGGEVRSNHIANVSGKTLRPVVMKQVNRASRLMTDTAGGYMRLGKEFTSHEMVDHEKEEYARYTDGRTITTNTVEGYFALLKRGVVGTYHSISEAHLHRYLAEFDFRYNQRSALGIGDGERATKALQGIVGKRLTYRRTNEAANA